MILPYTVERLTAKAILERVKTLAIAKWGEDEWIPKIVQAYAKLEGTSAAKRRSQIVRVFEVGSCNLDTAILLLDVVGCRLKIERPVVEDF